jgi:uncharacterized protein (TIGR02646 family)
MIKVKKNNSKPPPILKGKSCQEKIRELLKGSTGHKFNNYYYAHETVRENLNSIYHDKCAYCESDTRATAEFRIDHYRPKSEVKEDSKHPGYYWLAYEWSNLVPACEKCNNAKSSSFPIYPENGKRVMEPVFDHKRNLDCLATSMIYRNEKPLILHPEIDEPEKHIIFLPNGSVKAITDRGEWTIKLCKLNREGLVLKRKKIIENFRKQLEDLIDTLDEHKNSKKAREVIKASFYKLFQRILNKTTPDQVFSRLGVFMFEKFLLFFVEPLKEHVIKDEAIIDLVKNAYKTFKREHK